jgi:hypothetical protein
MYNPQTSFQQLWQILLYHCSVSSSMGWCAAPFFDVCKRCPRLLVGSVLLRRTCPAGQQCSYTYVVFDMLVQQCGWLAGWALLQAQVSIARLATALLAG